MVDGVEGEKSCERFELAGGRAVLWRGDCLDVLRALPDASVDSIVTDPPAGIAFMNKAWDRDRGGRDQWIAWMAEVARECLRVIRPGGHALVWALPRTSHWTATAWEDAGWEVRDRIAHVQGAGFPKSLDVSKAIDKAAGEEREVVGTLNRHWRTQNRTSETASDNGIFGGTRAALSTITAPATDAARQWDGWGTALKPAVEDWWLFRAPLAERTVAANVVKHGTGGLNIDACRVPTAAWDAAAMERVNSPGSRGLVGRDPIQDSRGAKGSDAAARPLDTAQGRWPANLVLTHHPECRQVGVTRVRTGTAVQRNGGGQKIGGNGIYQGSTGLTREDAGYADADGKETVADWDCHPDCPTRCFPEAKGNSNKSLCSLNRKTYAIHGAYGSRSIGGLGRADSGSAARFFQQCADDDAEDAATRLIYVPKASRADRNEGCENLTQDGEAGTTEGWENEDQKQHGKMGVTSPARDTCEETSADACGSSTSSCGNSTMDQCQSDTRCTTSTATSRTIESRTSPSSAARSTSVPMENASIETTDGGSGALAAGSGSGSRGGGTCPQRDGPCTGSAGSATSDESLKTNKSADGASERKVQGRVGRNTHPT